MARVSRKNGVSESPPKSQKQTVFRTALYVRLSVEDNGKADADSIENQELLLRNYLAERLLKQMVEREGVSEQLKTTDPMKWARRMSSIRNAATEITNAELIFV